MSIFRRKRGANKEEVEKLVFSALMRNATNISWHSIRDLCTDDEICDKVCAKIYSEHGLNIIYRGGIMKFE